MAVTCQLQMAWQSVAGKVLLPAPARDKDTTIPHHFAPGSYRTLEDRRDGGRGGGVTGWQAEQGWRMGSSPSLATNIDSEQTTVDSELTNDDSELTKVGSKLTSVDSKLTNVDSELTNVDSEPEKCYKRPASRSLKNRQTLMDRDHHGTHLRNRVFLWVGDPGINCMKTK